jgi:NADH:ubiquinone oxidoreductase subunit 3 (subunit A)
MEPSALIGMMQTGIFITVFLMVFLGFVFAIVSYRSKLNPKQYDKYSKEKDSYENDSADDDPIKRV